MWHESRSSGVRRSRLGGLGETTRSHTHPTRAHPSRGGAAQPGVSRRTSVEIVRPPKVSAGARPARPRSACVPESAGGGERPVTTASIERLICVVPPRLTSEAQRSVLEAAGCTLGTAATLHASEITLDLSRVEQVDAAGL